MDCYTQILILYDYVSFLLYFMLNLSETHNREMRFINKPNLYAVTCHIDIKTDFIPHWCKDRMVHLSEADFLTDLLIVI